MILGKSRALAAASPNARRATRFARSRVRNIARDAVVLRLDLDLGRLEATHELRRPRRRHGEARGTVPLSSSA